MKKILIWMSVLIVISLIIIYVILSSRYARRSYYYKTEFHIASYEVYNYHYGGRESLKCFTRVTLYEDDDYWYDLHYYMNQGYYINQDGKFYKLHDAIKAGYITLEQVKDSDITIIKIEKPQGTENTSGGECSWIKLDEY